MDVPLDYLSRYKERRKKDLELCLCNLQNLNFIEIEKMGHQLKGNGLTFGYPDLSSIGSHLEKAAGEQNIPKVEQAIKEFSFWVNENVN